MLCPKREGEGVRVRREGRCPSDPVPRPWAREASCCEGVGGGGEGGLGVRVRFHEAGLRTPRLANAFWDVMGPATQGPYRGAGSVGEMGAGSVASPPAPCGVSSPLAHDRAATVLQPDYIPPTGSQVSRLHRSPLVAHCG